MGLVSPSTIGQASKQFHGEVSSADASAGVTFSLFENNGAATAITLGATERLVITDIVVVAAASGNVVVGANADTAGKRVIKGSTGTTGGFAHAFQTPYVCGKGVVPKLFAPSGQADGTIRGFIIAG